MFHLTLQALTCISWHHEGRQFLCSHADGSFTTWDLKSSKPVSVLYPHARTITEDLKIEPCAPIFKIELRTCKNGEPLTVFTGGLPCSAMESTTSRETPPSTQSLTLIQGKTTTVLEMKSSIVSFVTICETPHDEPYAVLVLLTDDLMIVDLNNDTPDDVSSDGPKYLVKSVLPLQEPEQIGSLFQSNVEIPEAPKQGFFKGLFSVSSSILDREELFGEQMSGKGSKSIAKQIPGATKLDSARLQSGSLASELSKTRQAMQERGEHLEQLEDRTERMANEAEGFRDLSHQLLNKYKDKKWYQF